jgi:hypothetical protein
MAKSAEAIAVVTSMPVTVAVPTVPRPGSAAAVFEQIASRIRNEYLEMPGLSLTIGQAQRMWHLRQRECEDVFLALLESGFLTRTPAGAYVRAGSGRAGA